jgi:hypothetical protein
MEFHPSKHKCQKEKKNMELIKNLLNNHQDFVNYFVTL